MEHIGLKRNEVRVVEYRPEWASHYQVEAARVRACAGDLITDVQHIGSTAVPGLPAKPILDIAIAVPDRGAVPVVVKRLVEVGYSDRGYQEATGGHLLIKDREPDVRTVHLHIVETADSPWRNYIMFRDLLRRDPVIRKKYAKLKKRLARNFPDDRKSYTEGKDTFIRGVLNSDSPTKR
ncbi:MAG: GrpB family protein [Dehalococcoidia bacterium]|nr:GrpB family protein [Dehalococcoidia bacterium]